MSRHQHVTSNHSWLTIWIYLPAWMTWLRLQQSLPNLEAQNWAKRQNQSRTKLKNMIRIANSKALQSTDENSKLKSVPYEFKTNGDQWFFWEVPDIKRLVAPRNEKLCSVQGNEMHWIGSDLRLSITNWILQYLTRKWRGKNCGRMLWTIGAIGTTMILGKFSSNFMLQSNLSLLCELCCLFQ